MAENINAYCKVCGNGYHVCNTCLNQKTFKPWRTIVDSIDHYKIYLAIHGYTLSKDKEQAKLELKNCDLSGLENFRPEIKAVIDEIMNESENKKMRKPSYKINKDNFDLEIETDIIEESNDDVE